MGTPGGSVESVWNARHSTGAGPAGSSLGRSPMTPVSLTGGYPGIYVRSEFLLQGVGPPHQLHRAGPVRPGRVRRSPRRRGSRRGGPSRSRGSPRARARAARRGRDGPRRPDPAGARRGAPATSGQATRATTNRAASATRSTPTTIVLLGGVRAGARHGRRGRGDFAPAGGRAGPGGDQAADQDDPAGHPDPQHQGVDEDADARQAVVLELAEEQVEVAAGCRVDRDLRGPGLVDACT